jgi:hypothetical protein
MGYETTIAQGFGEAANPATDARAQAGSAASRNGADRRHVVLLKSLATNNRFYALVDPDSGLSNAGTVSEFPPDIVLGVAYPCLEDGLNDFAVIRTTFETLDFFPDDEEMRAELGEIIGEARTKLVSRIRELRDRLANKTAHFLGTDLEEFRSYALDMIRRGYPRRNLDSMMKVNVFGSVAELERVANGPEPLYKYVFRDPALADEASSMSARRFIVLLFDDILNSVLDDTCYLSRHVFDRDVFQKFIAMMFINYATTDPIFYGTHKADYGVSGDKPMDDTPLYMAVAKQLREIEAMLAVEEEAAKPSETVLCTESDRVKLGDVAIDDEDILGPIASICAAARRLGRLDHHDAVEMSRVILADAAILVKELKARGILTPVAYDPAANSHGHAADDGCTVAASR